VRITLAYDIRRSEEVGGSVDPRDNILTVQVQYTL
jgi:hypothetical protein